MKTLNFMKNKIKTLPLNHMLKENINLVIFYIQETNVRPHYEHSGYLTEKNKMLMLHFRVLC